MQKDDVIYRQEVIDMLDVSKELLSCTLDNMDIVGNDREKFELALGLIKSCIEDIKDIPSAQLEELTDDDFETIRIHLNAYKEKLCNQQRWKEAEEYQRIIDRFMAFASTRSERKKGKWILHQSKYGKDGEYVYTCDKCGENIGFIKKNFCPNCGADMRGENNG